MKKLQQLITSLTFQRLVNKRAVSACFGWLADRRLPSGMIRKLIRKFVSSFQINADLYTLQPDDFQTFNQFFTRQLKPEFLQFQGKIASFAEGYISCHGKITNQKLLQVKGSYYTLHDLMDSSQDSNYSSFLTVYLSLSDYHRVHFPFDATIQTVRKIPGTLFSLGKETLEKVENVYCRNERIIIQGIWQGGKFAMILVGAIVVGRIKLTFFTDKLVNRELYHVGHKVKQGDEAGYFEMGSTVILLLDNDDLTETDRQENERIKIGEKIC
jgi:phosphatidylserine decarboxylase